MDWAWGAEQAVADSGQQDGFWRLAVILGAIGVMALLARWRQRRNKDLPPRKAVDQRERFEREERMRNAADQALVELVETGREISAQVDVKIRMLNRLVKDAERLSERLEKLLFDASQKLSEQAQREEPAPETTRKSSRVDAGLTERSAKATRIVELHGQGKSIPQIARETGLSQVEVRMVIRHSGGDAGQ